MLGLLCALLSVYLLAVFARVVLSWFPLNPNGAAATVAGFLIAVTDPVMKPARRILPAARLGGVSLDLSPVLVIFAIIILQSFLQSAGICG